FGGPDEVGTAVAVEVPRGRREDRAGFRETGLLLGEPPAAEIVEEAPAAGLGEHEQVEVAVAVEVRGDGPARGEAGRQTGRRRDVRPGPVEVVAQQVIAGLRRDVQ